MKRQKSTHAAAAAAVKQALKAIGIVARVTSESYAGGDSIRAHVTDLPPDLREQAEAIVKAHQYGSFDGMTDCYNYTNNNDAIPQVKYAFLENTASESMKQRIWDFTRSFWTGMEGAPVDAKDAWNYRNPNFDLDGSNMIYRFFRGGFNQSQFWDSVASKAAAA